MLEELLDYRLALGQPDPGAFMEMLTRVGAQEVIRATSQSTYPRFRGPNDGLTLLTDPLSRRYLEEA